MRGSKALFNVILRPRPVPRVPLRSTYLMKVRKVILYLTVLFLTARAFSKTRVGAFARLLAPNRTRSGAEQTRPFLSNVCLTLT